MKPLHTRLGALLILLSLLPASSGLALGLGKDKNAIWRASANEFIRYADQDKYATHRNDHPVTLNGDEIAKVLGSIKTAGKGSESKDDGNEPAPLFTVQQQALLGTYLAEGLAGARPDQDILFALERHVDRFIGLKPDRLFVAGRAFYRDGKLNLIIGDYDRPANDAYESAYDPTNTGIVHYDFNYGDRGRPFGFDKALVTVEGIDFKQQPSGPRRNWLVIDLNTASESYDVITRMQKEEDLAQKRNELIEILNSENTSAAGAAATHPAVRKPSLESRLAELKRLREKDLITEEEYARKRKQLLDEL